MADPKNPFDFGTGSIDKDQWQRDIDNELDEFITRYTNATNKKSGLLLRQAFQDLRRRIASGDMLNRTADGLYQFGSALNRDDKDMTEAYQRALGFMGGLARRQIQAPPPEPEKKTYSSKILNDRFIRYFNPSGGQEAFTSLWNSYDDGKRVSALKEFLTKERDNLKNYQEVNDYDSMDALTARINEFLTDPSITNLNKLGFNRNYLNLLTSEEEEVPKSEEELLDLLLAAQLQQRINLLKRDLLNYGNNSQIISYNFEVPKYDIQADIINLTKRENPGLHLENLGVKQDWNKNYIDLLKLYINTSSQDLNKYFNNFAVNYLSILSDRNNIPTLSRNLARLFATIPGKNGAPALQVYDWSKYLTLLPNGRYMINNTLDTNGRFLLYNPSGHTSGIQSTNIYNMDLSTLLFLEELKLSLGTSGYMKKGGVIKAQQGLDFSTVELNTSLKPVTLSLQDNNPKLSKQQESNEEMDTGDWITILGTTAADIGSMLSANALGAGTALSAGLGVTSTLGNSVNDFRHGNVGSGLANLGIGLTTDLIGLVPGIGTGAKGWKIGRTLTRFARPILSAMAANNYKEAGLVMNKGLKNGWGSLNAEDWALLGTTLTSMVTRGKSAHTRLKNVEFMNKASQHSSPTDTKGNITKHIINELGLIKARKELLDQKRFGYNTSSKKYTKNVWNSIPEGGEISTPFYAKPFEWPKFGFGKNKKLKLVEEFEEFLKRNEKPEASPLGNGPEVPVVVPNENANGFYPMIRNGAKLKALRNGGIIKALLGTGSIYINTPNAPNPVLEASAALSSSYQLLPPVQFNSGTPEQPQVTIPLDPNAPRSDFRLIVNFGYITPSFFVDETIHDNGLDANRGDVLASSRGKYSVPAPNGKTLQNYKSAMDAQLNYYNTNEGKNIMGDVYSYYNNWLLTNPNSDYASFVKDYNDKVKWIRDEHFKKFQTGEGGKPLHLVNESGWKEFNLKHHLLYPSYGEYDSNKEDYFGESTWRRLPNAFDDDNDKKDLRTGFLKEGDNASYIHMKNDGTLELILAPLQNPNGVKEKVKSVDEETERGSIFNTEFKNPLDPTPWLIAGKTALGLMGNRNIYKNLLDEMPQAPLRDPIDRKLAIVGWQEKIKQGQNQLADLRNATWMQHGYDPQTNFAKMLETERVGRDISDKALIEDSGRQFETAGKSWNIDNEDYLYNVKVGDDNRKAIADRARMMAQIRAAWRSGDNNILMGALSDTGNWLLKKYQREQDLVDKVKEVSLGSLESYADWALRNNPTYKQLLAKKQAGTLTEADRAKMLEIRMSMLDQLTNDYANKYYSLYHTPFFGGGLKESLLKDGGKMEIAKLKARGKDNDRYVSMMKDMRKSSYRRRRR